MHIKQNMAKYLYLYLDIKVNFLAHNFLDTFIAHIL